MPADQRTDIVTRVATLDELQPGALERGAGHPGAALLPQRGVKSARVGGVKTAAGIVGRLDPALGNGVLEELREADEELEQQIQDNLILFESLVDVDDKGLQAMLREITSEVLLVALKGADQVIRDRFFKNMSKRAAEMLREDMQLRGPVRLAEVEEAQKEMLGAARRLAEAGAIRLGKAEWRLCRVSRFSAGRRSARAPPRRPIRRLEAGARAGPRRRPRRRATPPAWSRGWPKAGNARPSNWQAMPPA